MQGEPYTSNTSTLSRASVESTICERTSADLAMERYAEGDDAAFEFVYAAIAGRVRAFLRRRVRGDLIVEDLAQQTFLQMHRGRATFAPGSPVLPWALSIARRLLIDHFRYGRRRGVDHEGALDEAETGAYTDDGLLEARDLAGALQRELTRLPESQRTAFELMRFDGLSHIDAARTLGITVTAVKLRAHRAYVSLRAAVSVYESGACGRCV